MAYRFAWSVIDLTYNTEDEVELDFKLFPSSSVPGFVWGVVSKECLKTAKQNRWDLVSLICENGYSHPHVYSLDPHSYYRKPTSDRGILCHVGFVTLISFYLSLIR